jgi:hypothetical protein
MNMTKELAKGVKEDSPSIATPTLFGIASIFFNLTTSVTLQREVGSVHTTRHDAHTCRGCGPPVPTHVVLPRASLLHGFPRDDAVKDLEPPPFCALCARLSLVAAQVP